MGVGRRGVAVGIDVAVGGGGGVLVGVAVGSGVDRPQPEAINRQTVRLTNKIHRMAVTCLICQTVKWLLVLLLVLIIVCIMFVCMMLLITCDSCMLISAC